MKIIMITCMLLALAGGAIAQEDAEGCKDYPLLNRMPNYYLYSCEELELSSIKFPVSKSDPQMDKYIKTKTVERKVKTFTYALKEGAKPASGLQIMRNFQTAAKQSGAEILGEYQGWCS